VDENLKQRHVYEEKKIRFIEPFYPHFASKQQVLI
jgi:hypothetical protein